MSTKGDNVFESFEVSNFLVLGLHRRNHFVTIINYQVNVDVYDKLSDAFSSKYIGLVSFIHYRFVGVNKPLLSSIEPTGRHKITAL